MKIIIQHLYLAMKNNLKMSNHFNLKIKVNSQTLITVFIILFLIFGTSSYIDYRARKTSVINSMKHFSEVLSKTIQKSIRTYLSARKVVEFYLEKQNYTALSMINNYEKHDNLNVEYISTFAKNNHFYHISIFDSIGIRQYCSLLENTVDNIDKLIHPVLMGKVKTNSFVSFNNKIKIICFAIPREKGGVIVGSIPEQRINAIRNVANVETYLKSIATDSLIKYIAIQDSTKLIINTQNSLLALDYYQIDKMNFENDQSQWRSITYNNNKLFEYLFPVSIDRKNYGICRIGLDYRPIYIMHRKVLYITLIRLSILLIIGFFLFSYSISIQNYSLLEQEKEKITKEILQLQNNIRQKEKMSAIGQLAAGIAHEIRNPLNAISMTTQRIEKEYLVNVTEKGHKKLINIIRNEIERINNSIQQFLQFSRPLPLQKYEFRIDKIIDKVLQLYKNGTHSKRINFIWNHQNEITSVIDPWKIEDCLINIIDNAIASIKTKGEINVNLNQNSKTIIISIKDTGIGIPKANLSKIFNLYFTTKPNGNGLGLAHVHQIISEHGGKIEVKSGKHTGTEFIIILPNIKENQ